MNTDQALKKFNERLNGMPIETLQAEGKRQFEKNEKDFQELKAALTENKCSLCGNLTLHFSENKPCLHWLLNNSKGFKKKFFPLLFKKIGYHQMEAYLRWVASSEKPFQNINNLAGEKSSAKFIEETIKYKNLEWSFSCSHNDRIGHKDKHEGKIPHYHFQMKVDGKVIINYNGFHIPFNDEDEFTFAVKDNKIDRLKHKNIQGAGMEELLNNLSTEELIDNLKYSENRSDAQLETNIFIEADEGTTISGDEIADMLKERKRTGVSMAKLAKRLKNATVQTIIQPGPGVPEIAVREKNRNNK